MPSMPTTIDWLLAGPPFVEVQARLGLLGEGGSPAVREAHRRMIASPEVRAIVQELQAWPVAPLNSHKSAGHPIHKLTFLADLGLTRGDPGIDRIARRVMAHASPEGPFQVVMSIQPMNINSNIVSRVQTISFFSFEKMNAVMVTTAQMRANGMS